jgi:hypothetical protein
VDRQRHPLRPADAARRHRGRKRQNISFDEIRIDRHVGGSIVESWWIPDRFTLWQQLGLLPASPERPAD